MSEREAIAKIIDPYAWSDPDNMTPTERVLFERQSAHRRDTAYGKAVEILGTFRHAQIRQVPADRLKLATDLEDCITKSGGIDLRDPDLLRQAAAALRAPEAADVGPFDSVAQEIVESTPEIAALCREAADAGEVVAWHCIYPNRGHITLKEHEAIHAQVEGAEIRALVYASPTDAGVRERAVIKAVAEYHADLDRREHGAIAAHRAIDRIQAVLNMPWVQGATHPSTDLCSGDQRS